MQLTELLDKVRDSMGPLALPADLARGLLEEALASPDARELLIQAVFPWVHAQERARVREAEKGAIAGPKNARNPVDERPAAAGEGPNAPRSPEPSRLNPAQREMSDFLAQRCYVPEHGMVPWGAMTADLHRARVAYLARLRDGFVAGTNATIARHSYAIGLLEETGFANLDSYAAAYGDLPAELGEEVPA